MMMKKQLDARETTHTIEHPIVSRNPGPLLLSPCCGPAHSTITAPFLILQEEMRPRWLYGGIFAWLSVAGGRFLAVLLEDQLEWKAGQVGSVLAAAQGMGLLTTALWSGTTADKLEDVYPGYGRASMLVVGVLLGTVALWGHALVPLRWFWVHVLLRLIYASASAMIFPAMDGMCLDFLATETTVPTTATSDSDNNSNHKKRSSQAYGKERLWGAISWGITNMVLAIGLDHMGFSIMYAMSLVTAVLALVIVYCYCTKRHQQNRCFGGASVTRFGYSVKRESTIILQDDTEEDDEEEEEDNDADDDAEILGLRNIDDIQETSQPATFVATASTFQILRLIGSTIFGASFMLAQVTQSSGQAIVDQLVFLYFGDELGSSYTVMGATVVLTVIFEIPIFHIAPVLLHKWGAGPLIPLAALSYVSRVIGYSILTNPIHVLWLEPLHGVTYACMATAGVEIVVVTLQQASAAATSFSTSTASTTREIGASRRSSSSTGQSALQVLTRIGSISGLLVGGWLQEAVGARIMYRVSGLVVAIGSGIFTVAMLKQLPQSSSSSTDMEEQPCIVPDSPPPTWLDENGTNEDTSTCCTSTPSNQNATLEMVSLVGCNNPTTA